MSQELCGWIAWPAEVERVLESLPQPLFADAAPNLKGTGDGKTVLLYEAMRKVWGRDMDPGPQRIGDCVSWGFAGSIDLLACIEVLRDGIEEHSWEMRTCTEAIYALSRVEYGNLDGSYSDGSVGAWAAKASTQGGFLPRTRLGEYDPQRAKSWGAKGLPDEYEAEAKKHVVQTAALVQSWDELKAAIANGYPVPVCSNRGFTTTRDAKGRCYPSGSWAHCMKFLGIRDDSQQPEALLANSWGAGSPSGPKGDIDIPSNSWWVDAETADRMLKQRDSFALSQFNGYPAQTLPWIF